MEPKRSNYVNVALQEDVPEHILRAEDNFDSDEGEDEWETENSEADEGLEIDRGEEFEKGMGNPGWADAMAKILKTNAPRGKKSVVLAKAKKINDVKPKKDDVGFEIDGAVKEEKPDPDSLKQEDQEDTKNKKTAKKDWNLRGRLKPCVLEKNREKVLAKIATKGVVQLFNAVGDHQQLRNKKINQAGTTRKKEKVIQSVNKQTFLDMLIGSTCQKEKLEKKSEDMEVEVKQGENASWNVLRDDFMMGANMKDWDKAPESKLTVDQNSVNRRKEEESDSSDGLSEEESDVMDSNSDDSDEKS